MARDKARDDKYFNCSQQHEHNYVAGLYPGHVSDVKAFLIKACDKNWIHHSTHMEVYQLIKTHLGYPIPF